MHEPHYGPDAGGARPKRDLLDIVLERLLDPGSIDLKEPGLYTFLNPYTYLRHREDPDLLRSFRGVFVDSVSLVAALRALAGVRVGRASFDMSSLAPVVFDSAARTGASVFLIGGRDDEARCAAQRLEGEFEGLRWAGLRHGYFDSPAELDDVAESIAGARPDIVVAGMGAPLQERFLVRLERAGWTGLGFTCGAFLHQTATTLRYYPRMMDRLHLRWLVRLIREPHVLGRLTRDYPVAFMSLARDCWTSRDRLRG